MQKTGVNAGQSWRRSTTKNHHVGEKTSSLNMRVCLSISTPSASLIDQRLDAASAVSEVYVVVVLLQRHPFLFPRLAKLIHEYFRASVAKVWSHWKHDELSRRYVLLRCYRSVYECSYLQGTICCNAPRSLGPRLAPDLRSQLHAIDNYYYLTY